VSNTIEKILDEVNFVFYLEVQRHEWSLLRDYDDFLNWISSPDAIFKPCALLLENKWT